MSIDRFRLSAMLSRAADLWRENNPLLTDIDSRFGDGDHGVAMGKIADQIGASLSAWTDAPFKEFLENLGSAVMRVGGGSAGPLYGTLIGGLAGPLNDEAAIDASLLKKMFASCLAEMRDVTTAKVGEKTMMDAIIPAVGAAEAADDDDIAAILAAANAAAAAGAEASKNMISKFGRAKSYGEKTLGTPDAGAASSALFFQGLHEGYSA